MNIAQILKDKGRTAVIDAIMLAGDLAPEGEFEKRQSICSDCPYFGLVNVMGLSFSGCTLCGCPIETKGRMRHGQTTVFGVVKCPHPDGDKWNINDPEGLNLGNF